jgi:hypothetical protein
MTHNGLNLNSFPGLPRHLSAQLNNLLIEKPKSSTESEKLNLFGVDSHLDEVRQAQVVPQLVTATRGEDENQLSRTLINMVRALAGNETQAPQAYQELNRSLGGIELKNNIKGPKHNSELPTEVIEFIIAIFITLRFEQCNHDPKAIAAAQQQLHEEITKGTFRSVFLTFLLEDCGIEVHAFSKYNYKKISYFGGINFKLKNSCFVITDLSKNLYAASPAYIKNESYRKIFNADQIKHMKRKSIKDFEKIGAKINSITNVNIRRNVLAKLGMLIFALNMLQRKNNKDSVTYGELFQAFAEIFEQLDIRETHEKIAFLNNLSFQVYHSHRMMSLKAIGSYIGRIALYFILVIVSPLAALALLVKEGISLVTTLLSCNILNGYVFNYENLKKAAKERLHNSNSGDELSKLTDTSIEVLAQLIALDKTEGELKVQNYLQAQNEDLANKYSELTRAQITANRNYIKKLDQQQAELNRKLDQAKIESSALIQNIPSLRALEDYFNDNAQRDQSFSALQFLLQVQNLINAHEKFENKTLYQMLTQVQSQPQRPHLIAESMPVANDGLRPPRSAIIG